MKEKLFLAWMFIRARRREVDCTKCHRHHVKRTKYLIAGREHQNWFGMDEQLGPVAISIRKDVSQYRVIVRTSELLTLRGSVPEEALGIRPQGRPPTRELLELVAPEVQLGCLRLGTSAAEEAVARLDEQGLSSRYKVGVLYCRSGQRTEEEMYNNQHAGPAFLEFLDTIGTLPVPSFKSLLKRSPFQCECEWGSFLSISLLVGSYKSRGRRAPDTRVNTWFVIRSERGKLSESENTVRKPIKLSTLVKCMNEVVGREILHTWCYKPRLPCSFASRIVWATLSAVSRFNAPEWFYPLSVTLIVREYADNFAVVTCGLCESRCIYDSPLVIPINGYCRFLKEKPRVLFFQASRRCISRCVASAGVGPLIIGSWFLDTMIVDRCKLRHTRVFQKVDDNVAFSRFSPNMLLSLYGKLYCRLYSSSVMSLEKIIYPK